VTEEVRAEVEGMGLKDWREELREEILGYERKVRAEQERVLPFIRDTMKYLKKSITKLLPFEVSSTIKYEIVGSFALGTPYALSDADNYLDILLWSTEDQTLDHTISL